MRGHNSCIRAFHFNSSPLNAGGEDSFGGTLHICNLTSTTGAYFEADAAFNNSHIYSEAAHRV